MRVLLVAPTLSARAGGTPLAVVQDAKALQSVGVEVELVSTDLTTSVSDAEVSGGAQMSDLASSVEDVENLRLFPVSWPLRLAYSPDLRAAIASTIQQFDVVHIHSLFLYPQYAAFKEAYAAGKPFVVSTHGTLDPYLRKRGRLRKFLAEKIWQGKMLRNAAAIRVNSDDEYRLLQDLSWNSPFHVIPNALSLAPFENLPSPEDFLNNLQGDQTGPVILSHGRITQKKGLDLLIRAFQLVAKQFPASRLVLVGPDDEGLGVQLRQLAEELDVACQVVFTGMLRGPELIAALAAADVWVLSSYTENFGYAVVEAMAAGAPVVISKAVNIADDVESAEAGLVTELAPEDVSEKICSVLSNEELGQRLTEAGHAFATRYDSETIGSQLRDMYSEILSSHSQRLVASGKIGSKSGA